MNKVSFGKNFNREEKAAVRLTAALCVNGASAYWVGGAVRDTLAGNTIKDIDLCTDATPAQQVLLYTELNLRFIPTGIEHGTISVVLDDEVHEITSLRIDVETDGRHAQVQFTNDSENGCLNQTLLKQFTDMGYNLDQDYTHEELLEAFRRISQ